MLVETIIDKSVDKIFYINEFNFIKEQFLKFKDSLDRKLTLNDEINFLINLESKIYKLGSNFDKKEKTEESTKYLTISNIIHSMFYNPEFYNE